MLRRPLEGIAGEPGQVGRVDEHSGDRARWSQTPASSRAASRARRVSLMSDGPDQRRERHREQKAIGPAQSNQQPPGRGANGDGRSAVRQRRPRIQAGTATRCTSRRGKARTDTQRAGERPMRPFRRCRDRRGQVDRGKSNPTERPRERPGPRRGRRQYSELPKSRPTTWVIAGSPGKNATFCCADCLAWSPIGIHGWRCRDTSPHPSGPGRFVISLFEILYGGRSAGKPTVYTASRPTDRTITRVTTNAGHTALHSSALHTERAALVACDSSVGRRTTAWRTSPTSSE